MLRATTRLLAGRLSAPRIIAARSRRYLSDAAVRALTTLSEDELLLRDSVAKFAREEMAPKVMQMDRDGVLDSALLQKLFEQGLMGIEIPSEYGGSGLSFTHAILAIEEIAKVDPAVAVSVDIQNTLVNTAVARYGTPQQREQWLRRLAKDTLASFCLSESGSGSDAFALKTVATKAGGKYQLNGAKMWISNSTEAGLFLVFANAAPEKGYKGITAFVLDRGTPGLKVGKKEDKLGIRASSLCEVLLDGVTVGPEAVLGEPGLGYKMAISLLNEGRIGIAAQMVGLAQGALDHALPYLHQRKQFGQALATFQGVQFQVAEAATDIEAARLLVHNAARLKEAGLPFTKEAAMAKLFAARVAERVSSQCVEFFGGLGFVRGLAEKYFRDSKIGSIYEGTSNIQLQTIAKLISTGFRG